MKVVLDTNVLVSGFFWQGTPEELFILAEKNLITICVTQETLEEFERVLSYPKFKQRLARIRKTSAEILDEFLEIAECYPSARLPKPQIVQDPSDDLFLACALSARASCIISGDAHLLKLQSFRGIPIFTPKQFLYYFKEQREN